MKLGDSNIPAQAIQGIFLAGNISFFLSGQNNILLLISFLIIIMLFVIQVVSNNLRFAYLYPVQTVTLQVRDKIIQKRYPSRSIDTYILIAGIIFSIIFFTAGAIVTYLNPINLNIKISQIQALIMASFLIAFTIAFPVMWDQIFNKMNNIRIVKKLSKNDKVKFTFLCPYCNGNAEYLRKVEMRENEYWSIISSTCTSNCKDKESKVYSEEIIE